MNGANAYSQYRQTAVQTSSPEKLLLMLYDGAI
ncbi:MAG: flagellar protein FliS, partial [Syntrophomonadaceae bacterium]|nr:flagellar protein FliS [Syntrophomonadaceae bacterium]